jgi:hypothetical protein
VWWSIKLKFYDVGLFLDDFLMQLGNEALTMQAVGHQFVRRDEDVNAEYFLR